MPTQQWYSAQLIIRQTVWITRKSAPDWQPVKRRCIQFEERILLLQASSLEEAQAKARNLSKDDEELLTISVVSKDCYELKDGDTVWTNERYIEMSADEFLERFYPDDGDYYPKQPRIPPTSEIWGQV